MIMNFDVALAEIYRALSMLIFQIILHFASSYLSSVR